MSTPLKELREYPALTRQLLSEGRSPFHVVGIADSRLIEVANQICVCHRVLAECRAVLRHALWPDRKSLTAQVEQTSSTLDELIQMQQELHDVKASALHVMAQRFYDLEHAMRDLRDLQED